MANLTRRLQKVQEEILEVALRYGLDPLPTIFELVDFDQARADTLVLRRLYDAPMEYLIDAIVAPRGFWGHNIGHHMASMEALAEPLADGDAPVGDEVAG